MCGNTLPFSLFQCSYHVTDKPISKQCKHTESRVKLGGGWDGKQGSVPPLKKKKTHTVDLNMATQDLKLFQCLYKRKSEDVDIWHWSQHCLNPQEARWVTIRVTCKHLRIEQITVCRKKAAWSENRRNIHSLPPDTYTSLLSLFTTSHQVFCW